MEMDMNNITIESPYLTYEVENTTFLFDGNKGFVLEINSILDKIINEINFYNGVPVSKEWESFINDLNQQYGEEAVRDTMETLVTYNEKGFLRGQGIIYDLYNKEYQSGKYKGSLWLNLSHDCNLKCTYCYGDGGSYGNEKMLMTETVAKECIDFWLKQIPQNKKVYKIAFFGGEPLMNQKTLFFAVNYINEKLGEIGAKASYMLTTNGLIMNDEILELFKHNDFEFVVSIDGLEKIHNKNRPTLNGKGSYDIVLKNAKKLKEITQNIKVNMVVTKEGIPFVEESVKSLWGEGINYVNLALCSDRNVVYQYEDLEKWNDQIAKLAKLSYDNLIEGKDQGILNFIKVIEDISRKRKEVNCSLFVNGVLVFSPIGEIYDCYRYVGDEKHITGSVADQSYSAKLKHKKVNEKCSTCWAQILCKDGCAYENEQFTGDVDQSLDSWCSQIKIIFRESLKFYSKLMMTKPELVEKMSQI